MKYIYFFITFLVARSLHAQSKLVVIKATAKNVSINDGGYFEKNTWTLSPKAKPDVFIADRTRKTKWVIFYTDIDSIRVKVKPGTRYNFFILLNGKDSCYTQIASAIPPENRTKSDIVTHDTIPFTLTAFNAIKVKAVINNTDTLNLHFDASSFDFHLTKDAILTKTKLLSNQPDALAGKIKPNYNNLNKVYKLQIGSLIWNNPDVYTTGTTSQGMDGRFGWNLFEGKQVEINYDRSLIIIHSRLPGNLKGYVRSKIEFTHSFGYITGTFEIENKKYTGNFLMDSGSDQALILDSAWAANNNFVHQRLIKSSVLHDARNTTYEIRIVMSPFFQINNLKLTDIPTLILGSKNPAGYEINFLGNDLLKRFNTILDFKKDYIYLKPDKLITSKYREDS